MRSRAIGCYFSNGLLRVINLWVKFIRRDVAIQTPHSQNAHGHAQMHTHKLEDLSNN